MSDHLTGATPVRSYESVLRENTELRAAVKSLFRCILLANEIANPALADRVINLRNRQALGLAIVDAEPP